MKVAARDVNFQFWATAYSTLIGFALFVVLARFLLPTDFGLYALGTVVAAVVYALGQAGFVSLAYTEIDRSEIMRNTLFWANIITALILVLLTDGAVYVIVSEPNRRLFMIAIVSTLMITSVAEVANVALLTAQRFRALAAKQIAVQTAGALVALLATYAGAAAWSLVFQRLVAGLLEVVLVFLLLRWRPRFAFDVREFKRLLPSAVRFAGNASLAALETRLGDVVLGIVSTLDQVAVFRIAVRVLDSIVSLICQPISSVTSASVAAEPFNKGANYLAHVRVLLWFGAAPFAGLLFFGDILVPLVFGATWTKSGFVAQILAIQFFVAGPVWMADSALIATGRARELLMLRLFAALISSPLIIIFGMIGTKYIAFAISLRAVILLPIYVNATHFLTTLSTYETLKIASRPFLVAITGVGVARGFFEAARSANYSVAFALPFGFVIGGLLFLVLFLIYGLPELRSVIVWKRK